MVEWCDCRSKGTWQRQDGWTYDPLTTLWVHNRCRRQSRHVLNGKTYEFDTKDELRPVMSVSIDGWGEIDESKDWAWE